MSFGENQFFKYKFRCFKVKVSKYEDLNFEDSANI